MGVFPEPALCADDVSRLVPNETVTGSDTAARPSRTALGKRCTKGRILSRLTRRTAATLVAGLVLGSTLPQNALAPAASAHDRIDERAFTAQTLARQAQMQPAETQAPSLEAQPEPGIDWAGVPLIEQEPATLALIETDLAALPKPRGEAGDALRFGDMTVPRDIVETILRAASETGVDPVYMMALADKESSFSTKAKAATSSAEGLFQFLTGTWLELIRAHGARYGLEAEAAAVTGRGGAITIANEAMRTRVLRLRRDPYTAALMAGELIKRDRARIARRIGRDLDTSELYLAHFLGTASAGRFLTLSAEKPDEVATQAFRSAARANRNLFTQKTGKGRRGLTVAELRDRIDGMIDRRLNQYEGVTALAAGLAGPPIETAPAPAPTPARVLMTEALP